MRMLDGLRKFLTDPKLNQNTVGADGLNASQIAAAALLVEAALADGTFDKQERLQVEDVLMHMFGLHELEVQTIIADAEERVAQSNQLYGFAKTLRDTLEYSRRVELMQMLWEVVYADGQLDDFEANLVRRVNGLLYVTDQDSGSARKAALVQLGLDPETSA